MQWNSDLLGNELPHEDQEASIRGMLLHDDLILGKDLLIEVQRCLKGDPLKQALKAVY
jgi:hypothetical protein